MRIKELVREHKPRCLVIDPVSAMIKAGGSLSALAASTELLRLAKTDWVTVVLTSLLQGSDPMEETSEIAISTIADTWIHVSFVVQGGERNRALTVVKSRGTRHSNQVRELILSDDGVTLADVYTATGEVLMGTLRWEKERAEWAERRLRRAESEHKRRELETSEAETVSRLEVLKHALEATRAGLHLLQVERDAEEERWTSQQNSLGVLRGVDKEATNAPPKNE